LFWKRWSVEVLPHLVPRKQWNRKNRNVRVDDWVIIADPVILMLYGEIGKMGELPEFSQGMTD
jgi:hypothetical protein